MSETKPDLEVVLNAGFDAAKAYMDKGFLQLADRLAALEARELRYFGVYDEGRQYQPGNFCTYQGALWHCQKPCLAARPGQPGSNNAWLLACKSGSFNNKTFDVV